MPETPQIPFSLADALKGVELKISGTLPGETLISKMIDANLSYRSTMDADIVKRWDRLQIQQAEDLQSIWRGLWIGWGVLKP